MMPGIEEVVRELRVSVSGPAHVGHSVERLRVAKEDPIVAVGRLRRKRDESTFAVRDDREGLLEICVAVALWIRGSYTR